MTDYSLPVILHIVAQAISNFQKSDSSDLQEFDFGERVLTCRLGFFLSCIIETEPYKSDGLKVDCEYNRNIESPKRVGKHSQARIKNLLLKIGELLNEKKVSFEELHSKAEKAVAEFGDPALEQFSNCAAAWGDLAGALVYPDIIVHKRGKHELNLLVIEAKKETTGTADIEHDFAKLSYYTTPENVADNETKSGLNYKHGLFLQFGKSGKLITADYFENGDRVNSVLSDFAKEGVST